MARKPQQAHQPSDGQSFPSELAAEQVQTRRYIAFDIFDTMDTQPSREALDRKRLSWLENAIILAHNQLTVLPGPSLTPTQTLSGETIARMFFAFVNSVDYAICFCVSGAAYGVNLANGASTKFANAGTFSTTPDCTTWADQAILIGDPTAGYCAWTGNVFVQAGSASPNFDILQGGSGYTSAPTMILAGGTGGGAVVTATISGDTVTRTTLTAAGTGFIATDDLLVAFRGGNPSPARVVGFEVIESGAGYTSAPTVVITTFPGDTGAGATATAQIAGGSLSGLTLTQPGANYAATPFVSVDGGGGVTNATVSSITTGGGGAITAITLATNGSNYTSKPMVYIYGDGNGATATCNMSGATVASITITNGGSGYTNAGTKVFIQGGGSAIVAPVLDNVATAITQVWPRVNQPTSIAVFQGRVWLAQGRNLIFSGTTGYSDFDAANASGSTTITDADLVHRITALRSLNNFLFIFGDNSIKQIGSVTVSGSITNFSIVTLSSDIGSSFMMTIVSYNRLVMFANTQGIYAVFGASVEKISDPMDGVFRLIDFSQEPTAMVDDLFNLHTYQLLVKYLDPVLGARSLILVFQQKRWCVANQGANVQHMIAAPLTSNPNHQIVPFLTSGNDITAMFTDTVTSQNIIIQTALTFDGKPILNKRATRIGIAQTVTAVGGQVGISLDTENGSNKFSVSIQNNYTWLNANNVPYQWKNSLNQNYQWIISNPGFSYLYSSVNGSGIYLGMTLSGSFNGVNFHSLAIEYTTGPLFSSNNLL